MIEIAKKYQGIAAGPENGIKGYQLTYMIAYIRDMALQNNIVAESFETSCPWSNVSALCKNVKQAIYDAGIKYGKQTVKTMWVSFRVTQLYETGAAIYVYFSIKYDNLPMDKVSDIYEEVETRSREEVFRMGGCISHHHGVGKLRKRFMEQSFSNIDMHGQMFRALKNEVDPKNIFAVNNTIYRNAEEREKDMACKVDLEEL